jgi:hypothetical protein
MQRELERLEALEADLADLEVDLADLTKRLTVLEEGFPLARAIARGSDADIAKCLRRVNLQLLRPSIQQALADRLGNPRAARTRASAWLYRSIAFEANRLYRSRLAAGAPERGLKKTVVLDIVKRRGVSERTVRYAIRKHRNRCK